MICLNKKDKSLFIQLKEKIMDEKKRDPETDRYEDLLTGKIPSEGEIILKVGESVKEIREKKGLSLKDIFQRTGLQPEFLMDVEKGKISPPLGAIIKLAKALEMKMGYFISGAENLPYTVVRKNDHKLISRYDSKKSQTYGYEFISLAPHKKDRHMEPFLVTLEPSNIEERSTHDGQEFIFVLEGTMEVHLGEKTHLLEPGDAIYYDSTVSHLVKCHGRDKVKILAVLYAE
jgi:quercetin dioxygenase-like cupin family protein/ribosome-binding protein aMBF1 (putative translation factor)